MKIFAILPFMALALSLNLSAFDYTKETFYGVHHFQTPFHQQIKRQCQKNPDCLKQEGLGLVLEYTEKEFVLYKDENLIRKEIDLLDGEYIPKRTFKALGTWKVEQGVITMTVTKSEEEIPEDEKIIDAHIISAQGALIQLFVGDVVTGEGLPLRLQRLVE